jgi:hypothetical protein
MEIASIMQQEFYDKKAGETRKFFPATEAIQNKES